MAVNTEATPKPPKPASDALSRLEIHKPSKRVSLIEVSTCGLVMANASINR
jgi:hypothetical protein